MSSELSAKTEETLIHHLESFGVGDVDAILADFTEDSTIIMPTDTIRGLGNIRPLFEKFVSEIIPPGSSFQMSKQIIEEEIAYIVWSAESEKYRIPFASDTFLIRDGKIITQTIAFIMVEKD